MQHMTGTIRSAVPEDWRAIKQLMDQAALPTDDLGKSAARLFYVHADGARITGAVALEPLTKQSAMLRSLVVVPDARGRGVGHALVEKVEAAARSRKMAEIFLLTTTAQRFFSRLGYQRLDRDIAPDAVKAHEQFRALCPASAVLMSKRPQEKVARGEAVCSAPASALPHGLCSCHIGIIVRSGYSP